MLDGPTNLPMFAKQYIKLAQHFQEKVIPLKLKAEIKRLEEKLDEGNKKNVIADLQ